MELDAPGCYEALAARDARWDGVFFVGVASTGIYCRPVCRAKTPKREHCHFFPHAAAAEARGFRPCLRCRPELAPGHAPVDAPARLARWLAAQVAAGRLEDETWEMLAAEAGVTERHLRRVCVAELGAAPAQLARTHRLLLAKQLLADTALPVGEVALASGFRSLRRFNGAFREHYGMAPSAARWEKRTGSGAHSGSFRVRLGYRPPFAWPEMLAYLAGRAIAGVEEITADEYRRSLKIGAHRGWLRVRHEPATASLALELSTTLAPVLPRVLGKARAFFDVDARPGHVAEVLGGDALLAPLLRARPGLRVPGVWHGVEFFMRAIVGQQVSVKAATTLAGRIATRFGEEIATPFAGVTRLSPSAKTLAAASADELGALGVTSARVAALRAGAGEMAAGRLRLAAGTLHPEEMIARLQELPGVGEWTAHYIALRALRWPDAFPHADLGLLKAVGARSPRALKERAEAWRPWRGYAAMHLWHHLSFDAARDPNILTERIP